MISRIARSKANVTKPPKAASPAKPGISIVILTYLCRFGITGLLLSLVAPRLLFLVSLAAFAAAASAAMARSTALALKSGLSRITGLRRFGKYVDGLISSTLIFKCLQRTSTSNFNFNFKSGTSYSSLIARMIAISHGFGGINTFETCAPSNTFAINGATAINFPSSYAKYSNSFKSKST